MAVVTDSVTAAKTTQPYPLLVDVPVVFPRGGGVTLTFPIKQGDECLVVFASRHIDGWWQTGQISPPGSARQFDLSDGFAFVGPFSQKTKISGYSTDAAQLRSNDGDAYIQLNPTTHEIDAVTTTKITAQAGTDIDATAGGDINAHATGKITLQSGGDTDVTVGGNLNAEVTGNVSATAGGTFSATSTGAMSLTSDVSITLTAPTVAVDAPLIGLNGDIAQTAGGGSGTASLVGPLTVTNNVTAGGIDLETHTHPVTSAPGETGEPTG
jgi:hypothetical protein